MAAVRKALLLIVICAAPILFFLYKFSWHCYECDLVAPKRIVLNTWPFTKATDAAWFALESGMTSIDAVVEGCSVAESDRSISTVGFGGSPDEKGNTTLDAMVIDGSTHEIGAVAAMPYIKNAIKLAKQLRILQFLEASRRPNWRRKTVSKLGTVGGRGIAASQIFDGRHSGSLTLVNPVDHIDHLRLQQLERPKGTVDQDHHDTIGMIAFDGTSLAVGTSTNGAMHRVPGRVGDTPIPGAGGFISMDGKSAAVGTGDGDVLMRYALTYQVTNAMSLGLGATESCVAALRSVKQRGQWQGGLVAFSVDGRHGAACVGFDHFQYSLRMDGGATRVVNTTCHSTFD